MYLRHRTSRPSRLRRLLATLALSTLVLSLHADIVTAPWIAMQADDSIIVPLVHAPFIKKTFGTSKPGLYTLPQFRKVFRLKRHCQVTQARLQVCGLGHFECSMDGQKVSDHFLDPGWSDYRKSAEYVEFDVTGLLTSPSAAKRTHVIGVMLGNGFYNIPRERYVKLLGSYGAPKLKLSLLITYADGSVQEVATGSDWRVSPSPVTFSSIYGGEDYDARLEQDGWDRDPKFDDSHWQRALAVTPAFEPRLVRQEGTELKVANRRDAVRIVPTGRGTWIYDFGENLSGIVALRVKAQAGGVPAGRTIRIRPAELVKGNIDKQRWNLSKADQNFAQSSEKEKHQKENNADLQLNQKVASPYWFEYTTNDRNGQSWSPRFTYYGFRYAEVSGMSPDSIDLEALHTTSVTALSPVGSFHCSNDTLNRIHRLIDNAIRSNLASVLTDCPTREKLGWLEQAYLMLPSILCRYDMRALMERQMQQMAEAQLPNGQMPTIAPYYTEFGWGFDDSPEWGAAFILAPWMLYRHYGDTSAIKRYYRPMQHYIRYLCTRAREEKDSLGAVSKPRHILAYGLGDWYDLGPKGPGYSQLTPNGLSATATYYEEVRTMAEMARLQGFDDDATRYAALADSIREAYRQHFSACTSQTALSMGLTLGLLPDSLRSWAKEMLLQDLHSTHTTSDAKGTRHWRTLLTAGDIGFVYLARALADMGEHALLMQLCTDPSIPGYGMQLAKDATALTESWQALDNVSNNHLMLGHIMEWLYGYVGGIRQVSPTDYIVCPVTTLPGVTSCSCTYPTPYGGITVQWQLDSNGKAQMEVNAPAECKVLRVEPNVDSETHR